MYLEQVELDTPIPNRMLRSVVRLYLVVPRTRIGVISLVLLGCNAEPHDTPELEDQLSRIEARLDRMDERLQAQEHAAVTTLTSMMTCIAGEAMCWTAPPHPRCHKNAPVTTLTPYGLLASRDRAHTSGHYRLRQ